MYAPMSCFPLTGYTISLKIHLQIDVITHIVCIMSSLSLSQRALLEPAHWHHPTSARQLQDLANNVHSNRASIIHVICYLMIAHFFLFSIAVIFRAFNLAFSETSTRISSLAPSLISATSLGSTICTLRIAQFSFPTVMIPINFQLISHISLYSFIVVLSGFSTIISSLGPSHLSLATSLECRICTIKIASFSYIWMIYLHCHSCNILIPVFSILLCRLFRSLNSNQLTGTIPPQLGNLSQLTFLYSQNGIVLLGKISF